MYIRKITINNITSLKGEHIIDFTHEPLRSADLFAITGDTGAGKSTILDCICLALYNRAPRFALRERSTTPAPAGSKQLQSYDTRNVLRRGENEGSCSVEFLTGEGIFTATWSVRVKRTGTFDSVTRTLVQNEPKRKTFDPREVQENIQRLIGLDYEQFTRTVILAQNSFANFLKARRDDKSKLLEKITGTEIYNRISTVIYNQTQTAQKDFELKNSEYGHYREETLDEASKAENENRKNLLESQVGLFAKQVEYLKKQLDWYDTYEQLEARTAAAVEAYNAANRANVSMTQQREKLQRYDDVAEIRDKVMSVKNDEAKIAACRKNIESLSQTESEKAREKSTASSLLEAAKLEFSKCESSLRQQEPLFSKAHEILRDIEINENTRKEKSADLQQKQKETLEFERKIGNCRNSLKLLQQQSENCNNTLQSLLPHQAMLDQYGSVTERVRSYGSLLTEAETMKKRQQNLNSELEKIKRLLDSVDNEIGALIQKKETFEKNRAQLQNSILGVESSTLQKAYSNAFALRTNLQGARRLWDALASEYEEYDETESQLSSIGITIQNRVTQLHDLELEATKCKQTFDLLEKYFNMGQADNVKEMRKNLHEGEPCPVCGATHHPYHSETEKRLDEVVSNAERERNEAHEKYNAAEDKFNTLKSQQSTDKEKQRSLREKLESVNQRIQNDRKEWEQYATLNKTFEDSSANVNAGARRIMIVQLLENAEKTVEESLKKLNDYNKCHSDIEACTLEIENLNGKISELQKKRSDMLMSKGVNEGNLATIAESIRSNSDNAHEIYLDLEKLLTVADWRELIVSNQKLLRDRITEFHNKWNECNAEMRKIEEEKAKVETEIRALETDMQKNSAAIQDIGTRIEQIDNLISSSRNDLYRMFGDDDPLKSEKQLTAQLETTRDIVAKRLEELHGIETSLGEAAAKCRQAEEERRRLEEGKLKVSTEIDTWISAFNQSHSSVQFNELVGIFSSPCDWNRLRAELKKADDDFTLADDRMKAAQQELNNWLSRAEHPDRSAETRETISMNIQNTRAKQNETATELEQVKNLLSLHERAVGKMKAMKPALDELEKNAGEWGRLNDLIGSANGMAFSRVAQNYTLKLLVEHANAQLSLFSPRYRLRKTEDTLDLEIIDQYMGDELRPVSSLSGGETFVVSLALALGLASLSNNSISIGSLFIDEGFGNLDTESLDIVIHALGNLNAQGRKVGIISHTEQIRENIFPQIQVVRKKSSDSQSTIQTASF